MRVVVVAACVVAGLASSAVAREGGDPPEVTVWGDCLRSAADKYVAQDVPVETVASAAFGACKAEEDAVYQRRVKRSFGVRVLMGPPNRDDYRAANEAQDRMHSDVREQLIGYILEQRASLPKTPG